MSDDTPIRRPRFDASLNGVPVALDERGYRRLIREVVNLEHKGLQLRANASEQASVINHVLEVMTQSAIAESRMRDLAARELTAQEYGRFAHEMDEIHAIFYAAQKTGTTIGFGQMTENIRKQPIHTARQNALDDFFSGVKDAFGLSRGKRGS